MTLDDKEYLEAIKNIFNSLPSLFASDVTLCLTDREKFLIIKHAKSFKLNLEEGMPIVKEGVSGRVLSTKARQQIHYPKEAYGFPVVASGVPIINESTGNLLGTFVYAASQEKEQNVIDMASDLKSYAEQLTASAQEMASSAEELSASGQSITGLASEASAGIKKMDDILKYVTEVSNTTNLLGLNAAIEAARAGEQGRGFSVVAQEIRKLATQSKTSVEGIANSLTIIKNNINDILEFIKEFSNASESQAAQAEQLSANSESVNELSLKLLNFAEELNA